MEEKKELVSQGPPAAAKTSEPELLLRIKTQISNKIIGEHPGKAIGS
jgi:hypothetical protein